MAPERDLSQNFELGPYLQAAFICEHALVENNGVVSFIRIIDRISHFVPESEQSAQIASFTWDIHIVVTFKTGENPGAYQVGVQPIRPDNTRMDKFNYPMLLESPADRGSSVIAQVRFPFDMAGLWWFDVTLNNVRVSRIPMRIIYQQQPTMEST